MTIREFLASTQRNFIVAVLLAWLASPVAMVTLPPRAALLVTGAAMAVMVGAMLYLYRAARCPRCAARLWLSLYKLVPVGPFRTRLDHCPACDVPVTEPADPAV